jgi:hypothetical protein
MEISREQGAIMKGRGDIGRGLFGRERGEAHLKELIYA